MAMAEVETTATIPTHGYDEASKIWLRPFSAFINCMFPVEYVYGDWISWRANSMANRADPESLTSPTERDKAAGSRVEGFCIPQFILRKSDVDRIAAFDIQEHWQPDLDRMTEYKPFIENDEKESIQIFTVEHAENDPRYAKLRLTNEWKEHRPRYKNVSFLHHAFLLPSAGHPLEGHARKSIGVEGEEVRKWSFILHGPVRKLHSGGFPNYEEDQTGVFKYPMAWPEPAMEWLVRPRPSGWPSSDLVMEIFDSGCHLAPVGRGKRLNDPVNVVNYCQNPEITLATSTVPVACSSTEGVWTMEETEWRTSFSLAENKLGESVSPVQRHVMVLLKILKKVHFPDVISTYYLKNLLFRECESKGEDFWKEDNSGNCLLFMLDRLQECLKAHHLPHYIMPQSNLLMYEDPAKLNEAAKVVDEVRKNILPKTFSILRRLQSLTYQSQTYLQNLGFHLEGDLLRMQDKNFTKEDHTELLMAVYSFFVGKCKDVLASLQRITSQERETEKLINVSLYCYQSLLARNLCKLWFLNNDKSNGKKPFDEDGFKVFVKEEVADLCLDETFSSVAFVFFDHTRKGVESSLAIPTTRFMGLLREEQMKIAQEGVEEVKAQLKGVLDWLKTSDLKAIEEKASKVVQKMAESTVVTEEDVKKVMDVELALLFQEKMKAGSK
ncbi:uncharacterized protein [Montipora capricornis]|uniref:uncharacterized protein isoform X1 n=2 Tax=Montipora capricornis TaxID=246305 RepID=UPI0035F1E2F2